MTNAKVQHLNEWQCVFQGFDVYNINKIIITTKHSKKKLNKMKKRIKN